MSLLVFEYSLGFKSEANRISKITQNFTRKQCKNYNFKQLRRNYTKKNVILLKILLAVNCQVWYVDYLESLRINTCILNTYINGFSAILNFSGIAGEGKTHLKPGSDES